MKCFKEEENDDIRSLGVIKKSEVEKMTDEELKGKMKKDLDEIFNVEKIIDFHFDLLQKAYIKGLNTGLKINETASTETMLKELKDRGVIRSWYYNGTYHVGNELPK